MKLSRYLKTYRCRDNPGTALLYSTCRGSLAKVSDSLLASILDGGRRGPEAETLLRLGILVPSDRDEKEELRTIFDKASRNSSRYSALVTLNLDCNLACTYCYEDHFRGSHYMTEATADLLTATLLNGPLKEGKDIYLDFYGGEALLSIPMIHRIAGPLLDAASARGSSFSFRLVTNGTLLTAQTVAELLPLGLSGAKVTIDGPLDIHDRQRPFRSGKGSFTTIVTNLKTVCSLVPIQLGGNITRDNYRRFPELLELLELEGIKPDMLKSVCFSPIVPKAGDAGIGGFQTGCACSGEPWLAEAMIYLRREILLRGWNTPKPKPAGCMIEFQNDLVVGYDGSLFKCPAFMGWEEMRIGTLADGIGDYAESHNLDSWKTEECLECPYLPLCFGGCRFLQKLNTGSFTGVDCRKEFLDATLEEFIIQDQKLRK